MPTLAQFAPQRRPVGSFRSSATLGTIGSSPLPVAPQFPQGPRGGAPRATAPNIASRTELPPNVGGGNLDEQYAAYKKRLSSDTTGRAIDRATGSIADAAAAQKSAQATQLARRGVLGSGVGDQESGRIDAAAQRAQAGASADISLGRERDLDALVLGGQGIAAAPGQYALDRERVGQGWSGIGIQQAGLGLEQQRIDQSAQDQKVAQWLAMMRQFN